MYFYNWFLDENFLNAFAEQSSIMIRNLPEEKKKKIRFSEEATDQLGTHWLDTCL